MPAPEIIHQLVKRFEEHHASSHTPQEQEMVRREIEHTDHVIDELVYELYGLTDEEIKIVEGK